MACAVNHLPHQPPVGWRGCIHFHLFPELQLNLWCCLHSLHTWVHGGGTSPQFGYATPPPLPALRAHLVTKGQWLRAIHRVAPKAPENHLEERLLDQAQARASYTPLFWGHSRSIPQGMIFDVQTLYPLKLDNTFLRGGVGVGGGVGVKSFRREGSKQWETHLYRIHPRLNGNAPGRRILRSAVRILVG